MSNHREEVALRRAKRPRSIIAGPYGHPVHALMITLPIGAWTASVVFDVIAFFADDKETFTQGALWLIAIGTIGAVAAAIAGFLDYSVLTSGTRAKKIATTHMIANLAAIALFAVSFMVRLGAEADEVSVAGFVLSLIAIAGVAFSGFLGGELSYRHGVRVADETTQIDAYR